MATEEKNIPDHSDEHRPCDDGIAKPHLAAGALGRRKANVEHGNIFSCLMVANDVDPL